VSNPFRYGEEVSGALFAGRSRELDVLVGRMSDGINVTVEAPRRYGKSSLMRVAVEQLAAQARDPWVVAVNLMRSSFPGQLASDLMQGVYRASCRGRRAKYRAEDFAKRFRVRPVVEIDPSGAPRLSMHPGTADPPKELRSVLEDTYHELAAAPGPSVLVLDEFQESTRLDPGLPQLLKALADAHGASVSLVLAGSHRHLMEMLTGGVGAPLHKMSEPLALGPVDHEEMVRFVRSRMAHGGRAITAEVADRIVTLCEPAPHDIQRLAYEAYRTGEPDAALSDTDVAVAMRESAYRTSAEYAGRIEALASGQRTLLSMLAEQPLTQPTSRDVVRHSGLANGSSVARALSLMAQRELVVQRDGAWRVSDPFLAEWLRR
jgi:hypothetical protein